MKKMKDGLPSLLGWRPLLLGWKLTQVVYFNGKAARDFRLEWQSVEEKHRFWKCSLLLVAMHLLLVAMHLFLRNSGVAQLLLLFDYRS